MAWSLGLRATLFHWYVNIDYPPGESLTRVLCAVAGPIFSLCLGVLFWALYRQFRTRPPGLLLLYCSIEGVSYFLGNLFSTSFAGGDFGVAAALLALPASVRLVMTISGGVLLAAFFYRMGKELRAWASPGFSRLCATMDVIVWPVTLGTAAAIIVFQPMPASFVAGWIAASSFWIFAAAGAFMAKETVKGPSLSVRVMDAVAAIAVLSAVRILVSGVRLQS